MTFYHYLISIVFLSLIIYELYIIIFIIGFLLPRKFFSQQEPIASVMVAARNEEHCIERCIHSLCTQIYPSKKFEVIIVNDQSNDGTEKIIKSLQKKYNNLKLINIKNRPDNFAPKKFAIKEALKIAQGEIILTTDADITAKPGWIKSIVSFFSEDVGLVVGFSSIRNQQIKKLFQRFEALDFLMLLTATKGSLRMGLPISCSGQNLSFRRIAFDEIGGFGDRSAKQSGDDVLLLHRVRRHKKWKIAFADDPDSYVETDATKSMVGFLNQRIRWASMGVGQFVKSFHLSLVSVTTSIVNIGLILYLSFYWLLPSDVLNLVMIGLMIKFVFEFIIAFLGSIYFKKLSWLWFFPFLFIFYMPYILIISIFSSFGNFKWKENVYTKGNIINKK